jgi:uncharacterized OB-fold protein
MTEHQCPHCGTVYFKPQECDWCPVQTQPIPQPEKKQ